MFGSKKPNELKEKYEALGKSQAVIEFDLDGNILDANSNFLGAVSYTLDEVRGRHHSMFVEPAYAQSAEYTGFWDKLRRGEYDSREYRRLGKDGKEIWIQASYNPIVDEKGKPYKVVKFATEITRQKLANADHRGQLDAISKSQAVIEFQLDGTILEANENFLNAVGYALDEIKGKHHSMFAEPAYAQSHEYRAFWDKLRRGEYDSGEYRRLGKGGKEIWIQASYNPIIDMNGRPFKVVKYAADVTAQKLAAADFKGQIDAINKVQAVIHFNLDGTIIAANDLFLGAMGYTLPEIQGRHHSMFVDPAYAQSPEYRAFWESLRAGRHDANVYKRVGRGGKEIWIRASYNPILDMNGKPFKVVKYASDITEIIHLTEQATGNVQSVAAATEEMSSSISEISKNMVLSKQAVDSIVRMTGSAGTASERLIENVRSMESIVTLISDIAGQVNLLALNATIEAARAGDAGKGFAVVASEVKNLANQTAVATEQIAGEISTVQAISSEVAASVRQIVEGANAVDQYVNSVASAIEEQSAVTQEISGNSQHAAAAVGRIDAVVRKG